MLELNKKITLSEANTLKEALENHAMQNKITFEHYSAEIETLESRETPLSGNDKDKLETFRKLKKKSVLEGKNANFLLVNLG